MAKKVIVGGRIESKEVGGIVTGAAEILDDAKSKKQSVINQETDAELQRLDGAKQDVLTFDNTPTEGSNNPVKSGGVYAADKALSDAIEAILLLIPGAASALNKLVDIATMNSSISTATASFRGTYNVVTDLGLPIDATHEQIAAKLGEEISTADNNDYAFVQVPESAASTDIRRTERYKFNGTAWAYEYDLNTSGFTAAQWAAINSGITITLVAKLVGLPTSSELLVLLGQKQDTLTFDNVPTAGSNNPVKSGGINTVISNETEARQQLAQSVSDIDGRVGNVEEVIPAGAAANNKLVANNSMEAYVASIIDAITASFTIATADGHIILKLTQTNGRVASLTLTTSDIASAQALTALTGRVSTAESDITTINSNITSLGGRVSTNEIDIDNLQQLYNNLQQSKPVPVTALPSTGQQQSVIYRLAGTTSYSDYMWNGSSWVLMATYNNAIDPRPKKASQNLVTSGGVFDNMGALDVSELNATENPHTLAQYVDLSAALAAIPTDYRKGGMTIKFVQSSDKTYIQYRCVSDSFSANVTDWALDECSYIINDTVYAKVITDILKNILFGIMRDGTVYQHKSYTEIQEAVMSKIKTLMLPTMEVSSIDNDEWLRILCDNDYNIFCGFSKDAKLFANINYSAINARIKDVNNEISFLRKKQQVLNPIKLQHLSVVSRKDEWDNYRMQGMTLDYVHGYFFLAGNLRGTDNTTKIIKTSDLINFSDAVYIEGEYGHANDLTYNENTNCIYVAGGTGKNGSYNNTIYVFNAETLELVDEIEITDFSDVINIDYNSNTDTYIIGDYNNGYLYNAEFKLLTKNVIPLGEKVIDSYFDIPGSATAAQGIVSYKDITYKFYAAKLVSPTMDCGVLAAFDNYGRIMEVRIVTAPNLFHNEFESVAIDPIKKKIYCCWDGDTISFSESYIDFSASELPRTIIAGENLNHILGYGVYVARNAAIAESIADLEGHGYPIDIMGEQRHGFSIEVKAVSHSSLVQIFRSFKEYENENNEPVTIVPVAATRMVYGVTESGVTSYKFTEWVENINV